MTSAATTDAATTDAPMTDAATAGPTTTPFTMVTGDASAMVCEGDVCYVPGAVGNADGPA